MDAFQYELTSETTINLKYEYGGEYFTFSLYRDDNGWVLHPFDGILLRNQAMCALVAQELFKHKPFQVMLAKEGILFSDIRSTVNLENVNTPIAARNEREYRDNPADDLMEFVQQHSVEEVIDYECSLVGSRISFYREILQRMFMDNLGPSDPEFQKVQDIVRIYEHSLDMLSSLNGPNLDAGGRGR
ncbi:hypothetical protein AMQ84_10565 [Paenibacillus riograndensis]|uniref:Uncharacterized protein n=1 Tax=Paenibacillus riograndensis TaxID=483937 RepID=A0A132U3L7_9BACL|nr:hypothetical protein [Paenibacillus riograndensis]KWX78159.1 hypothetical protein AMQ84_10565 [Paenibacillus riograndensis]KWX85256.1 hypothetical protein AMQ83_25875 [Paenibacillus riograndensis]